MTAILVTGANRGIGLALVEHYLERGDDVIATARDTSSAVELTDLASRISRLTVVACDVTGEASLAAAAKVAGSRAIDVLVCNAGVMSSRGGINDPGHDAAEWSAILMANTAGVFLTARTFMPHVKRAKAGKIAVISSMMGSSAQANGSVYAYRASKAAATNIGLNLAVELRPDGIAVGIYHPGWVSTDLGGRTAPVTPEASAKGLVQRIDKLTLASSGIFEDYLGKPYAF
jgi:NAD(P)-dependent dehydrogenase (short-subunit alcohol dehydrogenase family)